MAYIDQYTLSQDVTFRGRVRVAMVTAAIAIAAEAVGTTNHRERAVYARSVLNNVEGYAPRFAEAVAADATISAGSPDPTIQTRVNAIWDAFAFEKLS